MKWVSKHLEMLKNMGGSRFKSWLDENASDFLSEVGVGEGQTILDFGCGSGKYVLPAAELVGRESTIYALDVDGCALDELEEQADSRGIENIIRIDISGEGDIDLQDMELDLVLLIDVLHEIGDTESLFEEIFGAIKPGGGVCVYPMHVKNEEVEKMAGSKGFILERKAFDENILLFSESPKS